jgi:hypothetical protein
VARSGFIRRSGRVLARGAWWMLLVIACWALWLWAVDAKGAWFEVSRITPGGDEVEGRGFMAGWDHGRMGIGWWQDRYTDVWLRIGRADAAEHGAGWRWEWALARPTWVDREPAFSWGPLHWDIYGWRRTGIVSTRRQFWAAYWSVALACGAWPMWSLLSVGRGWMVRRRRWWEGRCRNCGYDLRATPEGGAELLSRCPECGVLRD